MIHDPKVEAKQITIDLEIGEKVFDEKNKTETDGGWSLVKNYSDTFEGVDAAIFLTEWDEYRNINWQDVAKEMRKPAWIFDARSIFLPEEIIKAGLKLWRIGDGIEY